MAIEFWIGIAATIILVIGYLPLTWKLFKTKQTFGISFGFTLFILLATIIWTIYGILIYFNQMEKPEATVSSALSVALPILISNVILTMIGIVNISIKLNNQIKAKKMKMTEKQYCDLIHEKMNKKNSVAKKGVQ